MKICLVTMAPFVGGAEVALARLALGLQNAGMDVFLVLGQRNEVWDLMQRSNLRCLYSPMCFTDKWHWWRYRQARRAFERLLASEQPDLVHSNDLPTHQMVSDAASRLGLPRICHHRFPFDGPAIDWFNRFGAERHLFMAGALMEELCAESKLLEASSRALIYDGLPMPALPTEETRRQARLRLGLPVDKVLVIFAGQVIERKGAAELIQAWSLLDYEQKSHAELVIAGDDLKEQGKYRITMMQLAKDLHCPARFVGFQKDIGDWLLAGDIAAVPSRVEPMANANLEAMSYALPVVSCRVGGIPEAVVHEQTGLLVKPCNPTELAGALTLLLKDADLRQRFGANGRQRCEEVFSLGVHVRNIHNEYQMLLQPGNGRN